jgi:glycine/D-amino acid oxidase-like deaminating enzyme
VARHDRADARSPAAHPSTGEGLYTPIGYNGRGITTGTVFGKAMAELLTGMDPADLPLPISDMRTDRAAPLRARLYEAAFAANQIVKGLGR